MSKSSTTSTSKISTQLSQKSAWARGPPQTSAVASTSASPRSQSPAPSPNAAQPPTQTHSRRPSALGQGVSIKDGVSIPRNNIGAAKQGSAVTFGSIDDVAAPISSSPASVPPIKSEGVKSFGSVPAATNPPANGKASPSFASTLAGSSSSSSKQSSSSTSSSPVVPKAPIPLLAKSVSASPSSTPSSTMSSAPAPSSTPTPKLNKVDVRKLFQNPSTIAPLPLSSSSDTSSPAPRSSALPSSSTSSQPGQSSQPSQPSQLHSFTPFVPSAGFRQPTSTNIPNSSAPRSPAYPRQMTNGTSGGVGVGNRQSGAPGAPGGAPNVQTGMSSPRLGPPPHAGQPPTGLPPGQPYYPQYYYPQYPVPPEHYLPYPPPWMGQHPMPPPHHQQQGTPGPHPSPLPMSPRNPPPQLPPGTPTQVPALLNPPHPLPPSPSTHAISHNHSGSMSSPPPTPSSSSGPSGPGGPGGPVGANGARLNTNASTFVPKRITIKTQDGRDVDLENWRKRESASGPAVAPPTPTSQKRTSVIRMETVDAKNKRLAEEEKERAKKAAIAEEAKKAAEEEMRRKEDEEERLRREEEQKEREEEERVRKEEEERKQKEEKEKERLRIEEEEKLKKAEAVRLQREAEERRLQEEADKANSDKKDSAEAEEGEVVEQEAASGEQAAKAEDAAQQRKESLRIDTTLSSPDAKRRPGPLDLTGTSRAIVPPAQPSALATARIIEDLGRVSYPDGIMSPKVELNMNAKKGKFRYDRDFLLQFMAVCKEKPETLPSLDAIGLEPTDQASFAMSRGGSGRRQNSTSGMAPPLSRQASVGLGISGFKASPSTNFNMGNFATPPGKTSEERFAMSSGNRVASAAVGGPSGMPFGRPPPMVRSASQGGPGGSMGSNRTRSKRGEKRNDANKVNAPASYAASQAAVGLEPVQPLEMSANRWTRKVPTVDTDSPEVVDRKVKGLLNKLTMEKFDSISDQIIAWANKSEKEKDGRTLIQVIRLVFEKATDEAAWSEMYARLCRKMMERISPDVQDDGIKTNEGKPIAGGQLFRKYLLNRCQEDFERGWAAKDAAATAAAAKASEDEAAKKAAETSGEAELYSDEYYAAQKAKRQGLGLIQFIGELYKLQMLTERIMHECIKKLLGNVDNPEEEEIESLCRLLATVGQLLDNVKARQHMDIYFSRMKELIKSINVSSRMQFMLQDLIELRERKWIPRNQVAAPTTIAAVHEAAAKERLAHEKESSNRTLSMSRGGSRRGGDRGGGGDHTQGSDGWSVAGASGPPRPPPKAGDLSNFGKINKAAPMTFGPTSVFNKKDAGKRDSTLSRTNSNSNMFSMLREGGGGEDAATAAATAKSSRPSSRRTSVDFGQSGAPEPSSQRRKLQLLPRTRPVEETKVNGTSDDQSDDESENTESAESMSEDEANKKIAEDIKEFFNIRNIDESEDYFTKLPAEHLFRLVDKMVTKAIESKEADAQLVADTFRRAVEKNLCSPASFEVGFIPTAEVLDDIAIDAPKAFNLMAIMVKGAGLDKDEERRSRIADKLMDGNQLLSLLI